MKIIKDKVKNVKEIIDYLFKKKNETYTKEDYKEAIKHLWNEFLKSERNCCRLIK